MTARSIRSRRTVLALGSVGLLSAFAGLSGAAAAAGQPPAAPHSTIARSGGITGDPQPELKPFQIGASTGEVGSVAVESDGSLVVAYGVSTSTGETRVCVLARAGKTCKYTNTLQPVSPDSVTGRALVFAPSPGHVVVLVGAGDTHGDELFTSTDGGKTFGSPVIVTDTMGVDEAELVGSTLVFTENDDTHGVRIGTFPVAPTGSPAAGIATISSQYGEVGLGSYKGGVLVAGDTDGDSGPTKVRYAASGANLATAGSYTSVGSIGGQDLVGMSGNALVTQVTTGAEGVQLRLFNGTSFGGASDVPGSKGGGPEWFAVAQDPNGVTHVFTVTDRTSPLYELEEYSTRNGSTWTGPTDLGNAADNNEFAIGLDRTGSGMVLGTATARAYPVLATQSVSFGLGKSSLRKGRKTTGSGKATTAAVGRTVELQDERSGKWFTVATTKEKAGGRFSFTIKAKTVGTTYYRAVAVDHAGYVQFGYSAFRGCGSTGSRARLEALT